MKPKPILCVGALTCDLVLQVPELPAQPGKFMASRSAMVAAGMAASAATAVARLGHPVALWASAGDDMVGDFVVAEMASEGIVTDYVRRLPGIMSATAAILVDARGERVVVPYYDAALLAAPEVSPPIARDFAAVLVDVRWPDAAARALDLARQASLPAILDLDVGSKDLLVDLASRASIIAASLAGASIVTDATDAQGASAALVRRFGVTAIVTDGATGLSWQEPGMPAPLSMPAFPIEAVDTNAAGDIFHGALAVGIAEQAPLRLALHFASAAAAIKCTRYGSRAGAPKRQEVEAFLAARQTKATGPIV